MLFRSLTEVLVLDAFAALKASLRPDDDHDEASRSIVAGARKADFVAAPDDRQHALRDHRPLPHVEADLRVGSREY